MLSRTGRFGRSDRVLRSRDYQRISRRGRRTASSAFVLLIASRTGGRSDERARLGISASRKVGNAVARNRVKRGVREWFRRSRGDLGGPVDVVVIARRPAASLSGQEMWEALDALAARSRGRKAQHRGRGGA